MLYNINTSITARQIFDIASILTFNGMYPTLVTESNSPGFDANSEVDLSTNISSATG